MDVSSNQRKIEPNRHSKMSKHKGKLLLQQENMCSIHHSFRCLHQYIFTHAQIFTTKMYRTEVRIMVYTKKTLSSQNSSNVHFSLDNQTLFLTQIKYSHDAK